MTVSLLKTVGPPGSLSFLLACLVLGLFLMYVWPRNKRIGQRWLGVVSAGYFTLALPCVANGIAGLLPAGSPTAAALSGAHATVIVLDGDNALGRIEEAGRVYAVASPRQVWVLGDPQLVQSIIEAGVPQDRITHHSNPGTTREQIAQVKELVADDSGGTRVVIASRLQMPRVSALVDAAGLQLALAPSPVDAEPATRGFRTIVPAYSALCVSRDALYEHAALAYYRWRNWI